MVLAGVVSLFGGTAVAAPDWCKTPGASKIDSDVRSALEEDPANALIGVVGETCSPSNDYTTGGRQTPENAAKVAAARATWSKRLHMIDADWADVVVWANMSTGQRNSPTLNYDQKMAWTALPPIDQWVAMLGASDPHYLADALGASLTEVGRIGYIERCLSSDRVGDWALCQPDLDAFDPARFATQLRADKASTPDGYARVLVRIAAYKVSKRIAARTEEVAKLVAKDPGYAALFKAAATAHADWAARPPAAALLDGVTRMDIARVTRSNAAYAGCEDATWAPFQAAIGAIPAKRFAALNPDGAAFLYDSLSLLTSERDPSLASLAFFLCRQPGASPDPLVRFLGIAMERWPGFRGPRNAAHAALLQAEFKLDDRDARITYRDLNRSSDQRGAWITGSGNMHGGGEGVVAAVKPDGDKVRVEFVKKMVKVEVCDDWQATNRVIGLDASGSLRYEQVCKRSKIETVDSASAPRSVNARYATGVKPGVHVSLLEDIVLTVRPKAGAAPTFVYGAAVK